MMNFEKASYKKHILYTEVRFLLERENFYLLALSVNNKEQAQLIKKSCEDSRERLAELLEVGIDDFEVFSDRVELDRKYLTKMVILFPANTIKGLFSDKTLLYID